jgi:hypothetical protein
VRPIYRAVLLIRCRDGGVEIFGHAMTAEEWRGSLAALHERNPAHDPDPTVRLDQTINGLLRQDLRRKPTSEEIARLILEVAVRQDHAEPKFHILIAYCPHGCGIRIYRYIEEIDHRDAWAMQQVADAADKIMEATWDRSGIRLSETAVRRLRRE